MKGAGKIYLIVKCAIVETPKNKVIYKVSPLPWWNIDALRRVSTDSDDTARDTILGVGSIRGPPLPPLPFPPFPVAADEEGGPQMLPPRYWVRVTVGQSPICVEPCN